MAKKRADTRRRQSGGQGENIGGAPGGPGGDTTAGRRRAQNPGKQRAGGSRHDDASRKKEGGWNKGRGGPGGNLPGGNQAGSRRLQNGGPLRRRQAVTVLTLEELGAACPGIPGRSLEPLKIYLEILMQWNAVMNLVGTKNWRETVDTLIVDSFYLAEFLEQKLRLPENCVCWDLGAGAGIPGIPLRTLWDRGSYTLIEAREKRGLFLSTVLARVPLAKTQVFRGRAEEFFAAARTPPDLIVSRAFLPWREVLTLVHDVLPVGGAVIFLTREPLPGILPPGWEAAAQQSYPAAGDTRYFWALRRAASAE